MNTQPSFGAFESKKDKRTIKNNSLTQVSYPLEKGGFNYKPEEILNQYKVGICTSIHLIQNRQKANGKKYSEDFQYLLQKKFYDGNWFEGSSILNALKVAKKFGFLPKDLWAYTTEDDKKLPYSEYIKKLQAIPDVEIYRLLTLCIDKIEGYAIVDIKDEQAIAKAINESQAGILCRFTLGKEWWTSITGLYTYLAKYLNPLRPPKGEVWGHAIDGIAFDYTTENELRLANTWGSEWCDDGCAYTILDNYRPTEAWTITKNPIISKFNKDLKFGMQSEEVVNLQNALKIKGFFNFGNSTGYFGIITLMAVKAYQKANNIPNTGYVGVLTKAQLNKDFGY